MKSLTVLGLTPNITTLLDSLSVYAERKIELPNTVLPDGTDLISLVEGIAAAFGHEVLTEANRRQREREGVTEGVDGVLDEIRSAAPRAEHLLAQNFPTGHVFTEQDIGRAVMATVQALNKIPANILRREIPYQLAVTVCVCAKVARVKSDEGIITR